MEGGRERSRHYDVRKEAWVDYDPLMDAAIANDPLPVSWDAPRVGVWSGQPKSPVGRDRRTRIVRVATIILGVLVYFVASVLDGVIGPSLAEWLRQAAVFTGLLMMWMGISNSLADPPEDLSLLENPDDRSTFLVDAWFQQNETVTGKDRGALWFHENAMFFSGHACSFCIGVQDVVLETYVGPDDVQFSVKPIEDHRSIRIEAVWRSDWRGQSIALWKTLQDFFEGGKPATVPRQYPPFTPPPG